MELNGLTAPYSFGAKHILGITMAKEVFNFFISDKTQGRKTSLDPNTLYHAAHILKFFFNRICKSSTQFSHSEYIAGSAKWSLHSNINLSRGFNASNIRPHELLVYVVPNRQSSLMLKQLNKDIAGNKVHANLEKVMEAIKTHGGGTLKLSCGILSEVYFEEEILPAAPRIARTLAYLIFHEFMHNKIDADDASKDIHKTGGGGLAVGELDSHILSKTPGERDVLTSGNIELMKVAIGRAQSQCASFVEAFGHM